MKFDFPNQNGETLSGRLELPKTEPRAYALFAHCFTCSKDIVAANVISKALTKNNIAVLRFDFTGLGNSQGDFANTNFSSNVEDLISACEELSKRFKSPEIIIGHSLGGAAVLKAATQLDDVKAVVTIGAPSSVEHVAHLFQQDLITINKEGQANVKLAGRDFTIKKQFIDDIKEVDVLNGVKAFKKALLVFHSPVDDTVSIDHAANIFKAAKHPKSFVTLDNADHLLMKKEDASYVADVLGSWVDRYILKHENKIVKVPKGSVLVRSRTGSKFTQDIFTNDHHLVADEPASVKGENLGMNPYELLLAGLGACTSMTVKMYAERKGIQFDDVSVTLSHSKIHAKDCEDCESTSGKVDVIHKNIEIKGNFTSEQEKRLYEIAEMCPVNKTLQSEIKIKNSSSVSVSFEVE